MINTRDEFFMDKKLNISEVSTNIVRTNSYSTTAIPYLTKTDDLELLNSALRCLF